jgi:hypothetical protein
MLRDNDHSALNKKADTGGSQYCSLYGCSLLYMFSDDVEITSDPLI